MGNLKKKMGILMLRKYSVMATKPAEERIANAKDIRGKDTLGE